MPGTKASIAIIGAGMGGLTAAATLKRAGFEVNVYEQATGFGRIGAGIQMGPNAMKVLRAIGLEPALREIAFQPLAQNSREWDTGDLHLVLEMGASLEAQYGAPYLLLHRADLHAKLVEAIPQEILHRGKKLLGFYNKGEGVVMRFEDGSSAEADLMIAADGVHSGVRTQLFGNTPATYTGRVAYRTTFPASLLKGGTIDDNTKWWGPDRHIVIYYITRQRDEIYFVTSVPETAWSQESYSAKGDMDELRAAFAGFHPQVQMVLQACPEANKWPINERDPLPHWSDGNVVLLGDACHPMTPYMAQGAATSMEDGAVLTRCLLESPDIKTAFRRYEATRLPRTADIQMGSHRNDWLHKKADPAWVYGYDAWTVPLEENLAA